MTSRKQANADSIREWVHVLIRDPEASRLPTLDQLSSEDVKTLAIAIETAGAAWMAALVHEAMAKPEPSDEPKWTRKS